jgi:hypothetical protein
MSLTTISGEIQAQPLNDNFSYLDTSKATISGTLLSGNVTWHQSTGEVFFNRCSLDETTVFHESPFQVFVTQASGGMHGGVPNINGSAKELYSAWMRKDATYPGFTGLGSMVGYLAHIDSAGVGYDTVSPSVTYREIAAFAGYSTSYSGGLCEGIEVRATAEGTDPTILYGAVIQSNNNNTNTSQATAGILLQSGGSEPVKMGLEMQGEFDIGIDFTATTLDTSGYAINVSPLQKINLGGNSINTNIQSTAGTDIRFTCEGVFSFSFNQYAMRMPNDVNILQNAGVPVDGVSGTGAGFAAKGSLCIDTTNADLYINANTSASPTWKLFTRAV